MKKYKLIKKRESELFIIEALIDIPTHKISKGDLGGTVAGEHNLSHTGNAWLNKHAMATENTWIGDDVLLDDHVCVMGNSIIKDNAILSGDIYVMGNAVISGNAQVSGVVSIKGHARLSTDALITSTLDILTIGPIGPRDDYCTAYKTKNGSFTITDSRFSGSVNEFREQLNRKYSKDTTHWKNYMKMCDFFECAFA